MELEVVAQVCSVWVRLNEQSSQVPNQLGQVDLVGFKREQPIKHPCPHSSLVVVHQHILPRDLSQRVLGHAAFVIA